MRTPRGRPRSVIGTSRPHPPTIRQPSRGRSRPIRRCANLGLRRPSPTGRSCRGTPQSGRPQLMTLRGQPRRWFGRRFSRRARCEECGCCQPWRPVGAIIGRLWSPCRESFSSHGPELCEGGRGTSGTQATEHWHPLPLSLTLTADLGGDQRPSGSGTSFRHPGPVGGGPRTSSREPQQESLSPRPDAVTTHLGIGAKSGGSGTAGRDARGPVPLSTWLTALRLQIR